MNWWKYLCAIAVVAFAVIVESPAFALAAEPPSLPKVGAYYYPWYGTNGGAGGQWRRVFRQRLVPPQAPLAGLYRSDDPAVVKEHIDQSMQAGLAFWAVSWWGPGTPTDRNFLDAILAHPEAKELEYAILYESTGRMGEGDDIHYDNWLADIEYLEKTYFDHPQYLRVGGRPVLFVYLSRVYFRNRGAEALKSLREKFPDVYLVGDDVFGGGYRVEWAKQFDAVTIYDVYGQSAGIHGPTQKAVDALAENYSAARKTANDAGAAFIPTVAPGYNDTVIRRGHPGAARNLADVPGSQEGDLFRAVIRQAALPNLDPQCDRMMLVTSFNEWFEDSQIEATTVTAATTTRDDSESGDAYTAGARYEDYGYKYLDILREETRESRE